MDFKINPDKFRNMFAVPSEVVDRHIKLAGMASLKVLLWLLKNGSDQSSANELSEKLGLPSSDITDAIQYWKDAGIFIDDNVVKTDVVVDSSPIKKVVAKTQKPTREEIARRATESKEVAFLLRQAEIKFGRLLRQNESSTLVSLHDDEGLSASVLLMLIEYAAAEGSCKIGFIERTAISWLNKGVSDVPSAEREIVRMQNEKQAWSKVCRVMGIERRQPSTKEQAAAVLWVVEWEFSREMLKLAYDNCVDNTAKFTVNYINKILETWHKKGFTTPEQVKKDSEKFKAEKNSEKVASYDLDLFEQMLASGGKDE